ncbi:MAG: SDR family NAD(P)-dependent oxidoreductase [Saprospiraceae bacterium]|nr:SDR family NAD(P)-dependent oxidoreductase [Lewinella sp.]
MQEKEIAYALVTGGSEGIGRAIAIELAKKQIPLIIVALDQPVLARTAQEIREEYGVEVHTFGIDLSRDDAPEQVYKWFKTRNFSLRVLVNNAGFGRSGLMHDIRLSEYYTMIDLNNRATVGLTYLLLPELQLHPEAHILIMSSMEAALPLPYKAVYAGTKNFLYGYGLALREELAGTSVNVSILCPGPTVTNESGMKRLKAQPNSKYLVSMPDKVAKLGIDGMFRKKNIIVPGFFPATLFRLGRLMPAGMKMNLLEKIAQNFKNNPG